MNSMLIIGTIIIAGFIFGELANKVKLPGVTGYILAGVLLNPEIVPFIPASFVEHTGLITHISLSFITFSVGGTLLKSKIQALGRRIIRITLFESTLAFVLVIGGFVLVSPFLLDIEHAGYLSVYLPFSLLMGALAAPTDPSATLAVSHEYKAKGEIISTIMGVAAFDDAVGITLYSIAVAFAASFISSGHIGVTAVILHILAQILGALAIGALFGGFFNRVTRYLKNYSEGVFIVLIFGLLALCFGTATALNVDELLSTMFMGFIVVNYNDQSEMIFNILERYTEQLILILFFTISGMHLDVFVLTSFFPFIFCFVLFRSLGKFIGTMIGAGRNSGKVRLYTAGGLIPQGGIVIGLALLINQDPVFAGISGVLINVILGATVVHELVGPVTAKFSLKKAGEINEG